MRFLQGILLSLGLHLLLVWGSRFLPVQNREPDRAERVEFEVMESPAQSQQVVRQAPLPDEMLTAESEDPLHFLSEKSQRVKKQTRAERTGKTENRAQKSPRGQGGENDPSRDFQGQQNADLFKLPSTPSMADVIARNQASQNRRRRGEDLPFPNGYSTVGETLPQELEMGHFTALNTDKYLFYSFFVRVEDLIRYNWENSVRQTILSTPRGVFQAQNTENWVTQVDIQLKPNGEFHRGVLLKSSSIEGFDWAALDSFARAKIFPNPPREMVESDGLIHLRYSFTVRYRPQALVRRPQ